MDFPLTHPAWMWLYFGVLGTAGTILFILIMWNWMKYHSFATGNRRVALKWNAIGYMFLFFAQ